MRAGASLAAGGVALMLFRWLEYAAAQLKKAILWAQEFPVRSKLNLK